MKATLPETCFKGALADFRPFVYTKV
jgi:hypothetical protein